MQLITKIFANRTLFFIFICGILCIIKLYEIYAFYRKYFKNVQLKSENTWVDIWIENPISILVTRVQMFSFHVRGCILFGVHSDKEKIQKTYPYLLVLLHFNCKFNCKFSWEISVVGVSLPVASTRKYSAMKIYQWLVKCKCIVQFIQ